MRPIEEVRRRMRMSEREARRSDRGPGNHALGRMMLLGLAVGAGALLARQFPDLRRYLRMRSM